MSIYVVQIIHLLLFQRLISHLDKLLHLVYYCNIHRAYYTRLLCNAIDVLNTCVNQIRLNVCWQWVYYKVYSVHCTLYTVQCILYSVQCTLHVTICTLYTHSVYYYVNYNNTQSTVYMLHCTTNWLYYIIIVTTITLVYF